jgi:hypothetical protein
MNQTVNGITVFVRVCPEKVQGPTAPRRSGSVDKKSSFASSYSLKNQYGSPSRKSSILGLESDSCIEVPDEHTVRVLRGHGSGSREGDKIYTFDRVFPEYSSQEEVCDNVHDHLMDVVNGFNTTVICYGASKSGKSYTMTGTKDARGIIPNLVKSVFSQLEQIRSQEREVYFYAELGYVELYNNAFRDLLVGARVGERELDSMDDNSLGGNEYGELDSSFFSHGGGSVTGSRSGRSRSSMGGGGEHDTGTKIQVHESKNLGVFLSGSSTLRVPVSSALDVFTLYSRGQKARSSRITEAGHVSSRSHAVLILYLESRSYNDNGSPGPASAGGLRMSKLTFVDMAGTDRLDMSGAVGETLVESQNINLSLNAFGDVLFALSKNAAAKAKKSYSSSMQHVPFLNSKLTQLLKESLGGNSKTVLLTTIHSSSEYIKVTETSLQYATWARSIRGKIHNNDLNLSDKWVVETDPEVIRLKRQLEDRSR